MIQTMRVALWSILAGFFSGISVLGWYYSEVQELALAKQFLLEKDFAEASLIFESLRSSPWNGSEARVGSVLSSVLGEQASRVNLPNYSDLGSDRFPYRLLLFQALMDQRHRACLELAELLGEREEWAPLFRLSAHLELGDHPVEPTLSKHVRDTWLGKRIQQIQRYLKTDPRMVVYDRRGNLVGLVRERGGLELAENFDIGLLAPSVANQMAVLGGGKGYRLSVDGELSKIALAALEGYRGSIVILAIDTGQILAAVSDRRTLEKEGLAAFQQLREPASISKLITVTAAMRAGLDVDEMVSQMTCRGAERYKGGILYCSYRAGPLAGLNHAMAISCNIAFANLGVLLGRRGMLDELKRYSFGRQASQGLVYGEILERKGNQLQLADLSIGLEATSITPLHAALIAAVYGNHGIMPEPTLLAAKDGWLGLSPVTIPAGRGTRVIDPAWIPKVLASMEAVTQNGTANGISTAEFQVAMKTGTGRNKNLGFHTNYIGIGPMPNPKMSFCIRITDQPTSGRVRRATLRVGRRLFDGLSKRTYLLTDPIPRRDYRGDSLHTQR